MLSTNKKEKLGYESPVNKVYYLTTEQGFCSVGANEVEVTEFERVDEELD